MALFSRTPKKKSSSAKATEDKALVLRSPGGAGHSFAHVLRSPRITEKASMHMEHFTYVFDIAKDANKKQVSAAIQALYKVKPRKIAIVNIRTKTVRNMRTGKSGVKGGGKKAYVYLNKGETITIA